MRVATLTFHWASNYGAIIQAYALQQHLKRQGLQTEIIDYVPLRVVAQQFVLRLRRRAFSEFARERTMRRFRRRNLVVSGKRYRSRAALAATVGRYDAVICGSDQIWNEWFTLNAEGGPTRSYLLDFVPSSAKRIAYAASFGTDSLRDEMTAVVQPELQKFTALSVREDSGARILTQLGLDAQVVVDPTLLLTREAYDDLLEGHRPKSNYRFFPYLLHNDQTTARLASDHIASAHFAGEKRFEMEPVSVLDWLCHLRDAEVVLTNSFHGLVFCLVFRRPFIVVPVEGAGHTMNGRFSTLLEAVGLTDRSLTGFDSAAVDQLVSQEIDWARVGEALTAMREASARFITDALTVGGSTAKSPEA